MPDPTNDTHIEELIDNLDGGYWPEKHAALTALVAERDALKRRVAELEARAKPVYITDGQRVESIDLRERLVCAALTGVMAHPSTVGNPTYLAEIAVAHADAAVAAMRKGDSDGK